MPPLSLKATVTRRPTAAPVDQAERQRQVEHHEAVENAATTEQEVSAAAPEPAQAQDLEPALEPEQSGKQLKRDSHALQSAFLTGNLNKLVVIFLVNGLRLTGKLKQFDQFTVLIEAPGPMLIFKHAVSTIVPTR